MKGKRTDYPLTKEYDLVMDEEAKRRWQRAKPAGKVIGLPGYLVGGEWIGVSMPIACRNQAHIFARQWKILRKP